ncbi:hypothetical protein FDF36_17200 [Bacteroides fragilis]|nr:hypothetical protein [Bacteroides fragilis]CCZ38174.1 tonB-dependent receptor [Bacteroides fragilis CAG:558]
MNHRQFYVWFLCLFFSLEIVAQSVRVKGVILDEQNRPLVGAVVACLQSGDDRLLRGTTTDSVGAFNLNVDWQSEWIRISYLGYGNVDYRSAIELPSTVVLKPASVELGEVVIQGKSIITQKNDRLIFSIANSNLVRGNNTAQLLRFTPLIDMRDERISMLGKNGMCLYINGKKSILSGEAMQSYLRSLPAEKIDRIELIVNPGSEYHVGTNDGVLNLILKKDENQGWKGTVSLNDKQGVYNSYDGNLYLDYQKNKFALSISSYGNKNRERYDQEVRYDYLKDGLRNYVDQTTRLNHRYGGTNVIMDYQLSDRQRIGASVDVFYARRGNNLDGTTLYGQLQTTRLDSAVYARNLGDVTQFSLSANLNYRLQVGDNGSQFAFDADYLHTNKENEELLDYSRIYGDMIDEPYERFSQNTDEQYNTYSGKVEYLHVFTPTRRLQVGVEAYHLNGYNNFFYGDFQNGDYVSDLQKSNRFNMNEEYLSVYATYNHTWNSKFTSTLGFRGEYVYRHGNQVATGEGMNHHDLTPLPSLSLSFNPNSDHQLAYSLNTSIVRIPLVLLNPFRYWVSPTVYRVNNPDVISPYQINTSLTYVLKRHYIFSVRYLTGKGVTGFQTPMEGGYTQIRTESYGRNHSVLALFSWNNSFFNNYLTLNAALIGSYTRAYGHFDKYKINVTDFWGDGTLNANILLSKKYDWNVTGSFRCSSAIKQAEYEGKKSYQVSLRVRKVFKNNISLNFGIGQLLYKASQRNFFTDDYRTYNHTDYNFRKYYVGISIPFGRKKVSGAKYHKGTSSRGKERLNAQ